MLTRPEAPLIVMLLIYFPLRSPFRFHLRFDLRCRYTATATAPKDTTMRPASSLRPAIIALALLAPAAARADATAEQAQSLEQQLHDWVNGLVGAVIGIGDRPVHLTADGDHYKVEIPLQAAAAAVGFDAADATITATARPLPGDRWALDNIHIPASLHITGPAGGTNPDIDWSMKIAEQQISAVIDPSLTTVSSFDAEVRGQSSTTAAGSGGHISQIEHYVAHSVWLPTGDGRMDMLGNSTGDKMAMSQTMADGSPMNWSVEHVTNNIRIDAVAAASFGTMVRTIMAMVPVAMSAQQSGTPSDGLPPEARGAARSVVLQLRDLWSGFSMDETMDRVRIEAAGHGGSISKVAFGLAGGTRQGKLDLHMSMAVDGLESPEIPAGPLHDFVPRHIALKPRLFGVSIEDATQLALRAIDSDGTNANELTDQAMALLRKAPVTVGLDGVEIDLGSARLRGGGEVRIAAANDMTGHADIVVIGLDALIKQASAVRELKQGLPFLIMVKGFGKQEGNATSWKITYTGKKIMVNDNDLSAMLPGVK